MIDERKKTWFKRRPGIRLNWQWAGMAAHTVWHNDRDVRPWWINEMDHPPFCKLTHKFTWV